jgi:hypothetical protein
MTCSICKQDGHNKRSCKNITILASEAKTDIKVRSPVKVEMSCDYSSILKKALDFDIVDANPLEERFRDVRIKDNLDRLNKSRATQAVAIASLVAKLVVPDWDTRLHEVQIGGTHNLRSISGKVNAVLYSLGLLPTSTDYACLTPAFKGNRAPFNKEFTGSIKPRESLPALLSILELINTTASPELLTNMLQYILLYLKDKKKRDDTVKESVVVSSRDFSITDIINTLIKLHALGDGSSKLPVIVVFTTVSIIQPYLWPTLSIVPLKEHTEADKDRSCGDVEAVDSLNKPMIAIEIKHNLPITDSVIQTFDEKISGKDIPLTFILSTKTDTVNKFVKDDINIDTVNRFVTGLLQHTLFHKKNICSIFLHELRKNIVNHPNLNITIKESANEILRSLLVSPSL